MSVDLSRGSVGRCDMTCRIRTFNWAKQIDEFIRKSIIEEYMKFLIKLMQLWKLGQAGFHPKMELHFEQTCQYIDEDTNNEPTRRLSRKILADKERFGFLVLMLPVPS